MAHVKVWLVVCMTIALSGLAWFLPTQGEQRIEQLKQQLVPLQKSRDLHQRMHRYQQKFLKQAKRLARDKRLSAALRPLTQRGLSRWNWRERQAYRQITKLLKAQKALFRRSFSLSKAYLFSSTRRLLIDAGKPVGKVQSKAHPLTHLPMVESALQGKAQIGLWSYNKKPHFMASAPVYITHKEDQNSDDNDEPKPRKLVGVIFVKQALSQQLFVNLGFKSKDKSAPLMIVFNHTHPLLFRIPQTRKVLVQRKIRLTSAPPPGTKVKPLKKIAFSPLLQSLQRWTARHFSQFKQEAKQGLYSSSKPIFLHGRSYLYVVGQLPAPVSDGQVGYVMLHSVTQTQSPFYRSPFFLLAVLCGFFALTLGGWFSISQLRERSKLKKLLTDFSMDPESLKSVQQIPRSFNFLFQYLRLIAQKLKQRNISTSESIPMKSEELQEVVSPKTSYSMDMIRVLTEDGSMVLPERPKGMTYIQKPEKEEVEDAAPAFSLTLQPTEDSKPSPLSGMEQEDELMASAQLPHSLGRSTKPSDTPLPLSFGVPEPSPHRLEPSLVATAEPLSTHSPSTPPLMAPMTGPLANGSMGNSPLSSEGSALLDMLQSGAPQRAPNKGPVDAASLPMVLHQAGPPPEPLAPQQVLPEPVEQKQKNLTSELDDVFSMIAGSTPAPSIENPPAQANLEHRPMNDVEMRRVFDEYLNVRRSCGESTHNIQWNSFVDLLHKQRASIVQQYSCKDVQFYVQEKNGRASLKATPVN